MFQDGLFKGKKILITGGGTGLGRGMAQRLLILGAEIAICGRRKGVCDETAEALMKAHGGVVKAYGVDIQGNRLKIRVTNGRRAEFVVIL